MKTLISILGAGNYRETIYQFEGIKEKTDYVLSIIEKAVNPDEIIIIGTDKSRWELADKKVKNYQKILIPFGKNYNEFWKIFETLTALDVESKDIYLDLTHGFRSIPIFISTVMNFFEKVKNAHIKGIYYGMFEVESDIKPVVDLMPILEINRWIDGYTIFKEYGDSRKISSLLYEKLSSLPAEERKELSALNSLPKVLEKSSKAFGFTALQMYEKSLRDIVDVSSKVKEVPNDLKAVEFLIDEINKISDDFKNIEKEWEKQLKLAKIYFDKNRYSQSLTTLREALLTYILEENEIDWKDTKKRENILGNLISEDIENLKKNKQPVFFPKDLLQLIDSVRELRNKTNHGFIGRNSKEEEIKKAVEKLEDYLNKAQIILKMNKTQIKKMKNFIE
ncbi:CRISPR-associated protein, TM1812 family [Persephonella hydrogeniphila]|uniref:CRISPR-associated protein, TM1812 family n=1 Tax=Persephonella hydrogeniphila TaxID=198703 RepID=A0A285NHY3_9AQUI|nr:TIGR02221 family CRISPR-associated protein [Persephonella hydrogeniphila]SNZ09104.1 CRISPR-associated protein, TM1812 family [Persephonella hydrogeniphila]